MTRGNYVVVPFRSRGTRRDEVTRRLAPRAHDTYSGDTWASSAREALQSLGPVFAAFAAYMGSRVDLLPAATCLELARATADARPLPPDAVEALVASEAVRTGPAIVDLDPEPFAVSTVTQAHRARLVDGTIVQIEILAASFDESTEDLELLPLAEPLFARCVSGCAMTSAVADFRVRFQQEANLLSRAMLLQSAARDVARGAALVVPLPHPELCSARMIVTDVPVDEGWTILDGSDVPDDPPPVARAAVLAWLRQALFGSVCPAFVPGTAIAVCGQHLVASRLVQLPSIAQQHLLGYLFAVAGDVPDRAWAALQPELIPSARAEPAEHVERAFRRLVPFRDDRRTETGSAVADRAFLQWRAASQHGWPPAAHLVPFYQGLFAVIAAARSFDGEKDVLADAIAALRIPADARQLGAWAADADVMVAMERQMALFMELPQKLDRLLTAAADGAIRVQLVTAEGVTASRRSRAAATIALLLIVASLVVLAGVWPSARQAWESESLRSAALVATGALLVWAVGRFR